MKRSGAVTFLIASVASALIWVVSPFLTGHAEPWDAPVLFYFGALAIAGFIAGAIAPKPLWVHYSGAVVGQLTYELLFLKLGPLVVLGAVFLLGYSVIFLVAAMVGGRVRQRDSSVEPR